jgi:hypothetical protein
MGLIGGPVGTLFGIAAASPPQVHYAEPVYAPTCCYWTRGRPVWDSYRGIWIRPRLRALWLKEHIGLR